MIDRESPLIRDPEGLLRTLGASPVRVAELQGSMRVAWLADELVTHMGGSMHLMSQHLLNHGEESVDGPGLLAAFGNALAPFDEDAACYCRWVAWRAKQHAERDENESFVSMTNAVGRELREALIGSCKALLARWPDSRELLPVAPEALPVTGAHEAPPHYPDVVVPVELAFERPPRAVIDRVCTGIWREGAPDATLELCEAELLEAGPGLPEAVGEWVTWSEAEPDLAGMRKALFPPDPLEVFLGSEPKRGVNRVPAVERFDEARAVLERSGYVACCGEFRPLRTAVRLDPAGLLLRAADCTGEDAEFLSKLVLMEFTLVCFGDAPWLDAFEAHKG